MRKPFLSGAIITEDLLVYGLLRLGGDWRKNTIEVKLIFGTLGII